MQLKFKCVNSYCISWEYVCDGKWDCPRGHAETFKPVCEDKHACANMYRCKNTNLHLHLGNVCDGENCPLGDDEILCELQQVKCPSDCECLAFVLACEDKLTKFETSSFPHLLVSIFHTYSITLKQFS